MVATGLGRHSVCFREKTQRFDGSDSLDKHCSAAGAEGSLFHRLLDETSWVCYLLQTQQVLGPIAVPKLKHY